MNMNIILIAGSNRSGATSTGLSKLVQKLIIEQGHTANLFDLYEKPLPFYSPDSDYKEGEKERIAELQHAARTAGAIVLATPEYHSSLSGVLKNALDHLGQDYFRNKAVLSMSSSGGAVGTSSLQQLQAIVRNLHGINCPEWISIGGAQRNWFTESHTDNEGGGRDIIDRVTRVTHSFLQLAARLQ